ncbi:MAG: HAMP domain-containing histidine kinase, partial [Gemmatimonadetes bacterium]|nr:HAMP domain-containing histidine kinase [Gemmatimonadota bacterium]
MILALGGLAIVTLFAWTRTSRAATERSRAADIAIREYADFAARLFAQHTFELSGEVQLRLLRPVLARTAISPAAPLTVTEFAGAVRRELQRMPPAYDTAVVGFFVVDRAGQVLGATGDARTGDVAAAFVTTLGQPPPPENTDPRFQYRQVGHPELEVLFADTDRNTSGRIYALVFSSRAWRDALGNQSLAELPLLPPSYVDPAIVRPFPMRADSLLTIDVYGGPTVYRSPRSFSGGVAGEFDASNSAGVRIVTTLNPALVADFRQQLLGSPGNQRGPPAGVFPLLATLLVLALAAYAWRARRQNQARRGFVSTVSHEFRTPLAQMRMYTEMLLLGRAQGALESRQWIAIIMREARRLESSVENILFFSHLDALRTRLERETTDIGQLVESVVDGYVPLAEAREMRLLADAPQGMVMSIDPRAVRRMVGNLIDNALAFGPPGQTIRIDVARDGDDIVLSVTDEGPGIPRQQRQRIFQPFDRTDTPAPPGSGTGIGLAVVHGLVRQHGGRIEIRDADGGGASVVVTLPTGATSTRASRPAPAHDKQLGQQLRSLAVPALLVAIIALSFTTAWNLRSAWRAHLAATDRAIGELAAFGARLVTAGVGAELESVRLLALAG